MVLVPILKVWVPICPFPEPVVAPVMLQLKLLPLQLSLKVASGMAIEAVHCPASVISEIAFPRLIFGSSSSVTTTSIESVTEVASPVAVNIIVVIPILKL